MVTIVKTRSPEEIKKSRIYSTIAALMELPRVTVTHESDHNVIWVTQDHVYVPAFKLVWCSVKMHYRVYIYIAHGESNSEKHLAGYPICVIKSRLKAMGFCALYNFLHSNRGMDKSNSF